MVSVARGSHKINVHTLWSWHRTNFNNYLHGRRQGRSTVSVVDTHDHCCGGFLSLSPMLKHLSHRGFEGHQWIAVKVLFTTINDFCISTWIFHKYKMKFVSFNINSIQLCQNSSKRIFYTLNLITIRIVNWDHNELHWVRSYTTWKLPEKEKLSHHFIMHMTS